VTAEIDALLPIVRAAVVAWNSRTDDDPDDVSAYLTGFLVARGVCVTPPIECNCGWGGVHDPDNPRCARNGAVYPPGEHVHEWRGAASDPPWCACGATWPTSPGVGHE